MVFYTRFQNSQSKIRRTYLPQIARETCNKCKQDTLTYDMWEKLEIIRRNTTYQKAGLKGFNVVFDICLRAWIKRWIFYSNLKYGFLNYPILMLILIIDVV